MPSSAVLCLRDASTGQMTAFECLRVAVCWSDRVNIDPRWELQTCHLSSHTLTVTRRVRVCLSKTVQGGDGLHGSLIKFQHRVIKHGAALFPRSRAHFPSSHPSREADNVDLLFQFMSSLSSMLNGIPPLSYLYNMVCNMSLLLNQDSWNSKRWPSRDVVGRG